MGWPVLGASHSHPQIRLLGTTSETIALALALQSAGVSALAVHGRQRARRMTTLADWEAIREVKAAVSVPVIANGNVRNRRDAEVRCGTRRRLSAALHALGQHSPPRSQTACTSHMIACCGDG